MTTPAADKTQCISRIDSLLMTAAPSEPLITQPRRACRIEKSTSEISPPDEVVDSARDERTESLPREPFDDYD